MSLSAREQQALNSIKRGLAGSDPDLAVLLSGFSRLASGEEMPDRERIQAGWRRARRRPRRPRQGSGLRKAHRRLGYQRAALLVWLLATAALIATALALNGGGNRGTCTEMAAIACVSPAPGLPSHDMTTGQAPPRIPDNP